MKSMATNQTVSWFFQRYKEESLELSAAFQRNPVWVKPQKDYLIETLLLNLPMPEIYVLNQVTSKGESKWIVVDGQQRLRTILSFVLGELKVSTNIESHKHIRTFDDLSSDEKKDFWRYPIVVRDLEDSSDLQVRDLFQRINKYSVTLNDQELRKATFKGEFLRTITMLAENEYWLSSRLFSPNDIRRMVDLEFIGVLFSTMIGGVYNRQDRLDEFYVNYEEEFEEKEYYTTRFQENLRSLEQLFPQISKTMWRNKANFYTLFLLIDSFSEDLETPEQFASLRSKLESFDTLLRETREDDEAENIEDDLRDDILGYSDAARYGTNDKEKRVRRLRILREFIQSTEA